MATNRNILFSLFCIILCACPIGKGIGSNTDSLRLEIQKTYRAEAGVREATGNNDGPRILEYQKAAKIPAGSQYCAAGVTWTFKQHKIKTIVSGFSPNWFPDSITIYIKGKYMKQTPNIADVFGLYIKSKGRIGHVGFIDENWNNSTAYIRTFEFNTNGAGSDDGDGNHFKRRLKSQIRKVSSPLSFLK